MEAAIQEFMGKCEVARSAQKKKREQQKQQKQQNHLCRPSLSIRSLPREIELLTDEEEEMEECSRKRCTSATSFSTRQSPTPEIRSIPRDLELMGNPEKETTKRAMKAAPLSTSPLRQRRRKRSPLRQRRRILQTTQTIEYSTQ